MKVTKNLMIQIICSVSVILLFYSNAYAQSVNSYNKNTGYGAIWGIIICAWICNKYRKKPIGGWLLYYYIQLYGGTIFFVLLSFVAFKNYMPSSWDNQQLYFLYLVSEIPPKIVYFAEFVFASVLLKRNYRNLTKVNLLRVVLFISFVFSIISLAIDYTYWKESVSTDILGLVWSSFWFLYFLFSKRVKYVFIDNNSVAYKKNVEQNSNSIENTQDLVDITKNDAPGVIIKDKLKNKEPKFFRRFRKISNGPFRLIFVFSFIIPIIIGYTVAINQRYSEEETFIVAFISMVAYWLLIRIVIWIYDGFVGDRV